jgi:hypothetical protein
MTPSLAELTDGFTPVDWALLAVGLGVLLVFAAPYLATVLGVWVVRFRADDSPEAAASVEPVGVYPEYYDRFTELTDLGFRPVGVIDEVIWFRGHDLYKRFRVRDLVSEDGLTYASLYTLGFGATPVRVSFHTVTTAGVLVQTAMPGAGIPEDQDDFHRTEVEDGPVDVALDAHLREVGWATRTHGGSAARVSLAELAEIDERISRRTLAGMGLGFVWALPVIGGAIPFAVAGLGLRAVGVPGPTAVGIGLWVAAACYWFFAFKLMPVLHSLEENLPPCEADD